MNVLVRIETTWLHCAMLTPEICHVSTRSSACRSMADAAEDSILDACTYTLPKICAWPKCLNIWWHKRTVLVFDPAYLQIAWR